MKKSLLAFLILLLSVMPCYGANVTIGDLTADTSPTSDDLIETQDGGGGGSKKVTFANAPKAFIGGSDTHVQFNSSTVFGGEAAFTYDSGTNLLSVDNVQLQNDEELQNDADGDICIENVGGTYAGNTICFDVEEQFAGVRIKCDGPTTNDNCVFDDVVLMGDNVDFTFGAQSDDRIRHNSTDELFQFATKVDESNDADYGVMTFAIDRTNLGVTANQEIFEVGVGGSDDSDANYTEKLALDTEGDLTISGNFTANGSGVSSTDNLTVNTVLDIPSDAAPTVDADGETAIDTTNDQLVYYSSSAVRTIDWRNQFDKTLETPADADSFVLGKAQADITITDIHCIVDPADTAESVVIDIRECNSTADSCVTVDATITCDNDGAEDDGALSNGAIDATDWVLLDIGTVTGTVTQVAVSVYYTYDRK